MFILHPEWLFDFLLHVIYRCSPGLKLTQNPENVPRPAFWTFAFSLYCLNFYSYDLKVSSDSDSDSDSDYIF